MTPRAPAAAAARRAALLTGFAALAVAAIALKDTALEAWWLHVLRAGDREDRQLAAERLAEFRSTRAIPDLIALLGPLDREALRQGWGGISCGSRKSLTDLHSELFCEELASGAEPMRWEFNWAARALARIGKPAVPALIEVMTWSDAPAQDAASMALARIGEQALPELAAALHGAVAPKVEALRILKWMDSDAAGAALIAAPLLEDASREVRKAAAVCLASRGSAAGPAAPALIRMARDAEVEIRCYAIEALSRIDADSPAAAFFEALADPDAAVRYCAIGSIARLGPAGRGAISGLTEAIRDPDPLVRRASLEAIGKLGPDAGSAAPEILRTYMDFDDPNHRDLALETLFDIAPRDAAVVTFLAGLLENPDAGNRRKATVTLGEIGPFARAALPELTAALMDYVPEVRIASALALWKVGRRSGAAVHVLMNELDRDSVYFYSAANALGEIGPDAAPAIPRLLESLQHQSHEIRAATAGALWRIDPGQIPDAVRTFIEILEEGDDFMAILLAADALGEIGPPAAAAIPALLAASGSEDVLLRNAATGALEKIRQE